MLTVLTIARDVDRGLPRGGDALVRLVRASHHAIGSTDQPDDDPGLGGPVLQKYLLIRRIRHKSKALQSPRPTHTSSTDKDQQSMRAGTISRAAARTPLPAASPPYSAEPLPPNFLTTLGSETGEDGAVPSVRHALREGL